MKNKTKNTKSEVNKTTTEQTHPVSGEVVSATNKDLMAAIFIVSLLINAVVLITWIILQVTTAYDAQVAAILFP